VNACDDEMPLEEGHNCMGSLHAFVALGEDPGLVLAPAAMFE
jgi:hypothetical protein